MFLYFLKSVDVIFNTTFQGEEIMKFSNEAMRDVLMFFEEKIIYKYDDDTEQEGYTPYLIVENDYFTELFSKHKYTKDELAYTIEKMVEAKLLNYSGNLNTYYQIIDISFYGIQLLEKIRPESTWDKTKSIAGKVGNHALSFIEDTAQKIAVTSAASFINKMF